jgi:centrosomal protein CEP290
MRNSDIKEKEILKAAIRELQMESDDKLLIGKLHHHILTLQMNESNHIRSIERLQEKCLKLEHSNIETEKALDDRDNTIFQMRIDHKTRARLLRNNLTEARTKLSGAVPIEKYEVPFNSLTESLDTNWEM